MAILGLRGTGNVVAEGRPQNWREGILRLFPNGSASLTAFLALIDSRKTDDPQFNWWEERLPTRAVFINNGAGYGAGITTFVIDDSLGADPGILFRAGIVVMNTRTKEHMKVTADQGAGTSITVSRGYGETVAAALLDNDEIRAVGNANSEGAGLSTAMNFDPTKKYNLCQIFRTPLFVTRTARKTRLRTESAIKKAKIDALILQSIDMEFAFLWGERMETTGSNGQPERTTRGFERTIAVEAPGNDFTASGGTLNEAELLPYTEVIYRYGSTEKLWLCGSTFLSVLTQISKSGLTVNANTGDEVTYGIRLRRYKFAQGDGLIKQHPLFNLYTDWRQTALIIDMANLGYVYIDDLQYLRNRQSPGEDASKDEYLAECGLEMPQGQTHGIIRGVATFG